MVLQHSTDLPYTILFEERCGRLLLASQDISAGEILFHDVPGAVGPDNNPKPVCLNCYKRLPFLVYRCRHCSWPLCSSFCQQDDGPHARECQLFQIHSPRFDIEDYNKSCPWYNAIMVLRILWLRDNKPDTWQLIDMLMDHLEDKKTQSKKKNIVINFIRKHCKLTQFSEEEIRHVIGVIDTNGYIIGENPNKDVDICGLYPITSILNHSCTSNTICYAQDDFTFACRAVVPIKAGEELTTNYLHYHYSFFGQSYRVPELAEHWYFRCRCARCQDWTEFGTLTDSLVCTECQTGRLVPTGEEWGCGECQSTRTCEKVRQTLNNYWDLIEKTTDCHLEGLPELLPKLLKVFGENHYYILEVKRRMIESIGHYEDLAEVVLEKKVNLCRDHLLVQRDLAPGLSEYRAYLSYHIAEPLYWLGTERYLEKRISEEELIKTMEEVANHLLLVIQIWGPFRQRSSERLAAEKAKSLLETVDAKYLHRNVGEEAADILENNSLKTDENISI